MLVVEDHERMAELIGRALEEDGYAADIAHTAADGRWRAEGAEYDAVILDVTLPDGNGFDLCRELRAGEIWTPILMLTARDAVDDRVLGLDAGADDYLTKPFAITELMARIRALIRRGGSERPAVLTVGDLSLDPASRVVRKGDEQIDLTAKEFAVLEYLMRHPGEVVSRMQLIEHAWDFAYDGGSNVVDVYIRYLREKIDRPFGDHSIETARGAGYRLRAEATDAATAG